LCEKTNSIYIVFWGLVGTHAANENVNEGYIRWSLRWLVSTYDQKSNELQTQD